jgi:hypothetical protein
MYEPRERRYTMQGWTMSENRPPSFYLLCRDFLFLRLPSKLLTELKWRGKDVSSKYNPYVDYDLGNGWTITIWKGESTLVARRVRKVVRDAR